MTRRLAYPLIALLAAVAACGPSPSERAVQRWLRCEECNRGELDSVVQQGDDAVELLVRATNGPPDWMRERVRNQSRDRYARLSPPGMTEVVYVAHYDSSFVDTYQSHAIISLGLIPTPAARAALHQAMQNDSMYRRGVIYALDRAALIRLTVVAGDSQAAPVDSMVRIDPTVRVTDSVTGQPLPNIRVVFRVDSGGGEVTPDSVRRTGPDGRASVRWSLNTVPDSFNVLSARALRQTVRFDATAHGFTRRIVFLVQPVGGTPAQPLQPIRVAVVDAWNQRDTTFSGTAVATIIGTAISAAAQVVAGTADFHLTPIIGSGLRVRVRALGATPALSQPFDVGP